MGVISRMALALAVALALVGCQPSNSDADRAEGIPAVTAAPSPRWRPTPRPTKTASSPATAIPPTTREPTATPVPDLTMAQLRQLTFPPVRPGGAAIRLSDGAATWEVAADHEEIHVSLADIVGFGDLDGDRRDDAAVLLAVNSASLRPQWVLGAVLNRQGGGEVADTLELGDEIVPRIVAVQSGRIILGGLRYAAGDPAGSPSQDSRRVYGFDEDGLALLTSWEGPRQRSVAAGDQNTLAMPFAPGTTATLLRGTLAPLGEQTYVLAGRAGQFLDVGLEGAHGLVSLSLRGLRDGIVLTSVLSGTHSWSGALPSEQSYALTVVSASGGASAYALAVELSAPTGAETGAATGSVTPSAAEALTTTVMVTPSVVAAGGTPTSTTPATAIVSGAGDSVQSQSGVVYLTFEATGGSGEGFGAVLDELGSEGVTATFFLSADFVATAPGATADLQTRGHHAGLYAVAPPTLYATARADYLQALADAREQLGTASACVRPFYGALDATTRTVLAESGYSVALWDVDVGELDSLSQEARLERLLELVEPDSVLRFPIRNGKDAQTGRLLLELLPALKGRGYGFGVVCPGK